MERRILMKVSHNEEEGDVVKTVTTVYAVEWPECCMLTIADIQPVVDKFGDVWDLADCRNCVWFGNRCPIETSRRKVTKVDSYGDS